MLRPPWCHVLFHGPEPLPFELWLQMAIAWLACIASIVRGVDYLMLPQTQLTPVEQSAPLWLWAALLITGPIVDIIGYETKHWPLLMLGSSTQVGVYTALTMGSGCWWWVDRSGAGLRDAAMFFVAAVVWVAMFRTGLLAWDRQRVRLQHPD